MKRLLAVALFATLSAGTALAQDETSGYMVGAGAGFTAPTGDFGDIFDPSFSIGGFVNGPISGAFGWRAELSYDKFSGAEIFEDIDARYLHFAGGVQLTAHQGEQIQPYGYVTIGAYNFDVDFEGTESETDFGMAFGGGFNWKAGETWGIALDLQVNGVRIGGDEDFDDESSWDWYLAPRGYVTWNF